MRDPGQSILFTRYQNPALAAEAREMSLAFADFSYLRWATGEEDPERAWEMYFAHTQPQVRQDLDGLLKTFQLEDHDRAIELAGSVEAFILPSHAIESRVFVNPGEATGYLIGISPLLADLTAEIAWGMHQALPYYPEALPPGWEVGAMHAQETLDLIISEFVRAAAGIGEAHMPNSALRIVDEVGGAEQFGQRPRDYRVAAMSFALAHEPHAHPARGRVSFRRGEGTEHTREGRHLPSRSRRGTQRDRRGLCNIHPLLQLSASYVDLEA